MTDTNEGVPAPRITDEAVEAARRAREDVVRSIDRASDGTDWPDPMRAALEAALPYLQAQPVASRDRVAEALRGKPIIRSADKPEGWRGGLSPEEIADITDALLAAGVFRDEVGAKAAAWHEGHRTGWEHHQDGNYGNDYWDDTTSNPYRAGVES